MERTKEWKKFIALVIGFLAFYFLPFEHEAVREAIWQGVTLLGSYAREHVLLCLIPAFFIAGTITVFIRGDVILRLLGPTAKKIISYPIAAVSGAILAVCSCTILPLFGGIYKRGAGIGPGIAFLFTGPAINITALFLTGSILGWEISFMRLIATVISGIIIGMVMQAIFKDTGSGGFALTEEKSVPWWSGLLFLGVQMAFLIIGGLKIDLTIKTVLLVTLAGIVLILAFRMPKELRASWIGETWGFAKKILPYLFIGVFIAGILSASLPESVVKTLVGGNSLFSNLFASVFGMLMYFATLTEVPIVQSLMGLGMGKGPALALFMAGNSLSLPSMIVLTKLLGKKKAFTYFALVVVFSTSWGFIYGNL
jgi:uncharacterized membrane protein YraQ (UPF0718 family)